MAHRTDNHSDLTLFKNRLWKLMEERRIYTTKELAKLLYNQKLVTVKQKYSYDEPSKIYGNAIGAIDKKIQKHLNADTAKELQGEFVIAYCTFFGCSSDYLFGFIDCKKHDEQFIHNETGLSENAIKILTDWNNISHLPGSSYSWARNSIKAVSDLIEQNMYFSRDVLNSIADYIYYRNIFESPNAPRYDRNIALDKFRLALFTATNGLTDCIKSIYENIKKAPDTN